MPRSCILAWGKMRIRCYTCTLVAQTMILLRRSNAPAGFSLFVWFLNQAKLSLLPFVIGLDGKVMQTHRMQLGTKTLSLQQLEPGLFFLQLRTAHHSTVQRFIKQ